MTEFELTVDENNRVYLKEELVKILRGKRPKGLANAETILIYPRDSNWDTILKSIEVIKADIMLRKEREEKGNRRSE